MPISIGIAVGALRLNAPAGAWCSLTLRLPTEHTYLLRSQCTCRCVVLPDSWAPTTILGPTSSSQCTCRCVVLPDDLRRGHCPLCPGGLNAPAGAWCSLTAPPPPAQTAMLESQCTCRCVVLPDSDQWGQHPLCLLSQCTYRCMVLPDPLSQETSTRTPCGLNAPTGAWCSLTPGGAGCAPARRRSLNAPTGAWCSLTSRREAADRPDGRVSMHLQVRGAP